MALVSGEQGTKTVSWFCFSSPGGFAISETKENIHELTPFQTLSPLRFYNDLQERLILTNYVIILCTILHLV